ncbi:hypothetical protein PCC9214_04351 [Planktothrix tepida]|uniref:Uncharacterized protein n=1 Tax=Planktothrix tepida PCC 9214 TaxID=671072 RepID=A0A1J1LTY4_9CYAN|nr:hypothetical protein [Planktothrix tepida]CAD5978132.1 hypothetical protein PCC9214_04351 [Planktothrix tepida]CUR36053.1 hypothetical protein PL921480163 [Planktothrix tepida PCC 9214]
MLNEQDLTLISPGKAELVKDIFPDSPGFYTYQLMNFNILFMMTNSNPLITPFIFH